MALAAGDGDAAMAGLLDQPGRLGIEHRVEQPQPAARQLDADTRIVALRLDRPCAGDTGDQRDPAGELDRRDGEAQRQVPGLGEGQHALGPDLDDPAGRRLPDHAAKQAAGAQIEAPLEMAQRIVPRDGSTGSSSIRMAMRLPSATGTLVSVVAAKPGWRS